MSRTLANTWMGSSIVFVPLGISSSLTWAEMQLLEVPVEVEVGRAKIMQQVAIVLRQWPRTSAALAFGLAGTTFSALVWGPLIFPAKDALLCVLFIGVPGVSAAVAGLALGGPLLDQTRCTSLRAVLRGAVIGTVSLLLFAPLFAGLYFLSEPASERSNVIGLTVILIIGGALAAWGRVALISAVVGWVLYIGASREAGQKTVHES